MKPGVPQDRSTEYGTVAAMSKSPSLQRRSFVSSTLAVLMSRWAMGPAQEERLLGGVETLKRCHSPHSDFFEGPKGVPPTLPGAGP